MILSDYTRKDSPWVWFQYAAGAGQKKRYLKTRIRKDDPDVTLKVARERNNLEGQLLAATGATASSWRWVLPWLKTRYSAANHARTLKIYSIRWAQISRFLEDEEVETPEALQREHAFAYVAWRTGQKKEKSGKSPRLNSALQELKLLAMIVDEAVSRGMRVSNPMRKLGISKEETAIKPEILPGEAEIIFGELKREPVWMRLAFTVAWFTGLRLADTAIVRSAVDWQSRRILIERPKGGMRRAFSIPIYPEMEPLLRELEQSGRAKLWEPPKEVFSRGLVWQAFFQRIGLPHLSFHCTRVSFIMRGLRAGIPEPVMMKLVNHGSTLISRLYQRWGAQDVDRYVALLQGSAALPSQPVVAATRRSRPKKRGGP